MIYSPTKNIIIITPPHTASGNLHKALCREKHGGIWVNGPSLDGAVDHHYAGIPHGWVFGLNPKICLVVRNPYDRLIGVYLHYCWASENLAYENLSWSEFVYNAHQHHFSKYGWMYNTSISQQIKNNNNQYTDIIRYESIDKDIEIIIGERVEIMTRYHTSNILSKWYTDQKLLDHVNDNWAREDCVAFNYRMYETIEDLIKGEK